MSYDSTADTLKHVRRVQTLLAEFAAQLLARGAVHDDSKFSEAEKSHFDIATPKLKTLTFGTPEYAASLAELKPALDHHYAVNSHHPEHYPNGVDGMDLLDLVEMVLDWKAASERGATSALRLAPAFDRFKISPQLQSIIRNTAERAGWLENAK